MWLDVEEDDELKGAARIKVTVSEVIEKRGKKKRTRYQCKVILYGASDEEVGGFERFDHPFNDDPRSSSDAKGALKAKAMADFRRQKRTREEREQGDLEDSDGDDGPCFCLLLFIVSMLTSFFLLHVLPRCCLLPPAPRSSKRAARADVMNIGPNAQYPSWQTGTAHSSLSSAAPPAEEGDIVRAVQGLVSILKVAPEHQKAVQPAVDLIRNQVMQIEELRGALADVRAELDFIVGGLGGEELEVITALQDMIYDVLDMADTPGGGIPPPPPPPPPPPRPPSPRLLPRPHPPRLHLPHLPHPPRGRRRGNAKAQQHFPPPSRQLASRTKARLRRRRQSSNPHHVAHTLDLRPLRMRAAPWSSFSSGSAGWRRSAASSTPFSHAPPFAS